MSRVTSKLQVTVPKAIADQYGIRPGDEIEWVAAGEVIRVLPPRRRTAVLDVAARLKLFDAATGRQRARERRGPAAKRPRNRGWTRDELYVRGRPR